MKIKNVLFSLFIIGLIFSGSVFGQEKNDSLKNEIEKQQKEIKENEKELKKSEKRTEELKKSQEKADDRSDDVLKAQEKADKKAANKIFKRKIVEGIILYSNIF